MEQNKNIPAIRFNGFEGEWNKFKLGYYSKFRRGSFPQPYGLKKWYGGNGAKPFVQVVDVTKSLRLVDKTKQTISILAQPKSILANKGRIVVTLQGSIGRVAILQYDAFVDRTLLIFEDFIKETNEYFWAYSIQNIFEIEKAKAPGAIIKTITKEALSSFLISIPNQPEQTQIGNFFRTLDGQINAQEEKHQKLVNLKKAMLEKMFPKEGADLPEIRFNGFTDKWEEKKLGDIASFKKGQGFSKKDLKNNGTPIILYGRLYTKYQTEIYDVDTYADSNTKSVFSNGNEVIVPASGESAEDISRASAVLVKNIILGGDLNVIVPSYYLNSSFVAISLSYGKSKNDISKRAKGKSVVHVHNADLKDVKIIYPSIEEQESIIMYFRELDKLIKISKIQIKKYKNIKQALLQKMFV